jgi:hypothetical protein
MSESESPGPIEEQLAEALKVPGELRSVQLGEVARELEYAKEKFETAYAAAMCEGQIRSAWKLLQPNVAEGKETCAFRALAVSIVHAYKNGHMDQRKT